MAWEYQFIEGVTRHIEDQVKQAAAEGWEPIMMSTVGQEHGPGRVLIHTTVLLRREAQPVAQAAPTPTAPAAPGPPPPPTPPTVPPPPTR